MQRIIKTFLCVAMLAMGWQQARGFALLGPPTSMGGLPATYEDTWQTPVIGYDLGGDLGTPKNISQGYRRNDPTNYYAFDQNFSGFFGLQGEQAIDAAMAILNNTFTNNSVGSLDGYSAGLTEFPFNSESLNYTAQSLALTDLKSQALAAMMEQLGLAQPERYVWTLADRFLPPGGTCPADELYLVVQRNYNEVPSPLDQIQYSSYVNNTLYSYEITEACTGPNPLALAVPFPVDPESATYTAVAGLGTGLGATLVTASPFQPWASPEVGGFYTGLTRDDVAGLRYLLTSNNIVFEDPTAGVQLETTNTSTLNLLETSDLSTLLQFAQTNPPAVVQAAFPNLQIETVSNYFTIGSNPIVSATLITPYGAPAGAKVPVVVTNGWTFFPITNYFYTFGNIVYVHYNTNTVAQQQTVSIGLLNGEPATGPLFTNVNYQTVILTNVPSGDYYLIPPGSCGFDFVSTLLTNNFVSATTNVIAAATNTATGFVGSVNIVTYFTNDWFEYFACNFQTSGPAEYQGIGHMQFIRVADTDVDPLTGTFYIPVTNTYSMVWFNPTNSQISTRQFRRIVTRPDFLFSASDLASPNNGVPQIGVDVFSRNVNFDINNILPNLAGPGTINPSTTISFNEVGDIFGNGSIAEASLQGATFLSQITQGSLLAWASFDGTTNDPYVYPSGTSIQELQNQLIINITPASLPAGTNGVAYQRTAFSATGGQPPYTWSLNGTQLPTGLAFFNGVLSGTPYNNSPGTYDFTIQLTDADNRVVNLPYSIDIIY